MKNPQALFLILVVAVALVFGGYLLAPTGSATPTPQADKAAKSVDPSILNNSDAPRIGKAEAKIQIVVFSDYECPYCKQAHDIINDLISKYPNDVSSVQRNFIVHPTSEVLAKAAEAAHLQGKYKEMNDALFGKTVEAKEDAVVAIAKELGLDIEKFKNDLNSDKIKSRLSRDNSDAEAMQLSGTPSVFVNNEAVENFNNLPSIVDGQLGK